MDSQQQIIIQQNAWRDYLELCKPRVVAVMLLTAVVGMCLATPELPPIATVVSATLGIGLMAAGAAAVNHVMDRNIDAKMARTHRRPLPQGKIDATKALIFAGMLSLSGVVVLVVWTNVLTAWLTLGALIGYAVVYTMVLKRATPLNIVIGGIAGAAPPLLGWVAVTGRIESDSLLLVLIIFAWTPPHFWALCIHKKDDYARAGIPMLPVTHGEAYTRLHIMLYSVLMVLTTLFPFMTGMSGVIYLMGVTLLNLRFIQWAVRVYRGSDRAAPIAMFWFSVKYIMWLFAVLLVDHYVLGLN
ncbi:heme o synthase [Amphritea japonica]|uniref:Protoheme IX farnesyltransferase n=1 Tax=Amphritea japonica ATCC BAA-1530 TaxID=1278309 RepID=A0A7R6STP4_9GAMM|nr:heme o synthase [Amphritea japonica]BBB27629.1 protoheme IX farnesyltransferase [Amphritea japonica ATCC BAA-1530]